MAPTSDPADRAACADGALAPRIQHTLIRPGVSRQEITNHCLQAAEYGFDAAMVPGAWVETARQILAGTGVKVASAVDFPHGGMTTAGKVAEARQLAAAGAQELDIGVRTGQLRSGMWQEYRDDIAAVVNAVEVPVKVMLELPLLSRSEAELAVELAVEAGARWLKNASSGAVGVATPEQVAFLRRLSPAGVGVKASGGINTARQVRELIAAGADLVGTSAGLAIIGAAPSGPSY
ncbi:MAG TPA: deoxyribose-phosphate aldolase [Acidimicrobiales bacterium]|nr:deoxyribose-phosphate aldolase [Acidimicrobiales bacterium]